MFELNLSKNFRGISPNYTLMSILLLGSGLFIAIYFSMDFFKQAQYSVNKSPMEIKDSFKEISYKVMMAYPKIFQETTRLIEYDLHYYNFDRFKECSEEQYNYFRNEPKKESSVYICKDNHVLNNASTYWFDLVACHRLNTADKYWIVRDPSCVNDPGNETFEIEIWHGYNYYNISYFDSNENDKPTGLEKRIGNIKGVRGDLTTVLAKYNFLELDDNYLLEEKEEIFFTKIQSKSSYKDDLFFEFELPF